MGKHVLQPLTKPIESVSSRIRPIILPARDEEPDFGGRQHSYGYHNNLMAARVCVVMMIEWSAQFVHLRNLTQYFSRLHATCAAALCAAFRRVVGQFPSN